MIEKKVERIADISLKTAIKSEITTTPKIYTKIFEEVCKSEGVDIEEACNNALTQKIIDKSIIKLDSFIKDVRDGINQFQDSTKKAEKAIINQDLSALKSSQEEVKKLQEKLKKLEQELYTDSLTGVYNRKWLDEKVLDSDNKFLDSGFMAIVDLDKFKDINDNYGHTVGDKVLKIIASKLLYLGKLEIIRYGGDEFIVLLKSEVLTKYIEKILRDKLVKLLGELKDKAFSHQHKNFHTLFSFGVSKFEKGDKFEYILDRVDKAMYRNKKEVK